MKKFTSLFLAFLLIASTFCFTSTEVFAKTVSKGKLSSSVSSSIYVGNKASIKTKYNKKKVKKGITYKSSNKEVATVSKNGVVKALKKGTANITVKYKKKTVKIKVTVINKPEYGTVVTKDPVKNKPIGYEWYYCWVDFTWEKYYLDDGTEYWGWSSHIAYYTSEEKEKEWEKYALPVIKPTKDGKYEGQTITREAWVWLP